MLLLMTLLIAAAASAQKKKELTPRNSVAKVVLKGQQEYTYYAMSEQSKTEYAVTGPGKLTLNFRVRVSGANFKSVPFVVKHIRSDKKVETVQVPELLAGNLKFKSQQLEGSPTRAYKVVINVPPGKHRYKFYKYKTDQKVHMRAFYLQEPKPQWADLNPEANLEAKQVRFHKTGTTRSYFRITRQDAFQFTTQSPVRLRLIVRPEFTYQMLEETTLKVRVKNLETGESKIYKVNTRKSNRVEFVGDPKRTPGTSSTIYLNLDESTLGQGNFAISLVGGAKGAILRVSQDQLPVQ